MRMFNTFFTIKLLRQFHSYLLVYNLDKEI